MENTVVRFFLKKKTTPASAKALWEGYRRKVPVRRPCHPLLGVPVPWKRKGAREKESRESNDHCLNRNLGSKRLQGPRFGVICAVWGAGIWAWIRWQLRLRPLSARSPLELKVKGPLAQDSLACWDGFPPLDLDSGTVLFADKYGNVMPPIISWTTKSLNRRRERYFQSFYRWPTSQREESNLC